MTSKIEKRLGERIAAYRKTAGLTQEGLAERVGIAPETISRLERGVTIPSIITLLKISAEMGVELRDFFDFNQDRSEKGHALDAIVMELTMRETEEIQLIHDLAKRVLYHVDHNPKAS